mmetsp:Transcript_79850/g.191700  ORF Transcript_79850/g.191700 Transcript_79850/m.191700 type:complete len:455 (+) Transcript_79850:618-1982(+)
MHPSLRGLWRSTEDQLTLRLLLEIANLCLTKAVAHGAGAHANHFFAHVDVLIGEASIRLTERAQTAHGELEENHAGKLKPNNAHGEDVDKLVCPEPLEGAAWTEREADAAVEPYSHASVGIQQIAFLLDGEAGNALDRHGACRGITVVRHLQVDHQVRADILDSGRLLIVGDVVLCVDHVTQSEASGLQGFLDGEGQDLSGGELLVGAPIHVLHDRRHAGDVREGAVRCLDLVLQRELRVERLKPLLRHQVAGVMPALPRRGYRLRVHRERTRTAWNCGVGVCLLLSKPRVKVLRHPGHVVVVPQVNLFVEGGGKEEHIVVLPDDLPLCHAGPGAHFRRSRGAACGTAGAHELPVPRPIARVVVEVVSRTCRTGESGHIVPKLQPQMWLDWNEVDLEKGNRCRNQRDEDNVDTDVEAPKATILDGDPFCEVNAGQCKSPAPHGRCRPPKGENDP